MSRRAYPTDLSDAQWTILEPLVPPAKPGGRPALHPRRELVNAMLYVLRSGEAWRLLPHEFPPWQTVYHYYQLWRDDGIWDTRADFMMVACRGRAAQSRNADSPDYS